MADSASLRDAANDATVDVNENQAVDYWTSALGVDEYRLRTAVAAVGTSAAEVRTYLGVP